MLYLGISGSAGNGIIPEVTSDPGSPPSQSSWVLHTSNYQFSFQTIEGFPIRMLLV